jgi:hypothetical protein
MTKLAVMLLADADTPEDAGRMANALTTAKEANDAGDEIRVVLDGAGTKWASVLRSEEHKYHWLFEAVRGRTGACVYWAHAYGGFRPARRRGHRAAR